VVVAIGGLTALASPASAATADLWVSPSGSDTTGTGSSSAPWATIQKARDYISAQGLNDAMTGDVVVHVRPGTYYQTSTIAFTNADSGSNGHQVIYRAEGGVGSAHLVGGQPVTGWSPYAGNVYRSLVGTSADFSTLYENGTRARLARTPNYVFNPALPSSQAPYLNSQGVAGSRTALQYAAADYNPAGWNLAGASVNIWSGSTWDWFSDKARISDVNTTTHQLTLTDSTRYGIGSGSRYFVQGVLDLLDQPGEFYLDRAAGYLYYYPRYGAIANQTIIAPKVKQLVSFTGSSETALAHDIVLDGVTLEMTDFSTSFRHAWVSAGDSGETHTYPMYDRQINLPADRQGMVFMTNTDHITITNAHLNDAGYSAVYMLFHNQHNEISNSLIEHTGHSGVYLEGRYPGEGDVLNHTTITNTMIHDVGELVGSAAGVHIMNSSNNTLSSLEIYNSPRYAISIAAYRDPAIAQADVYARGNTITNVRIHDVCQDSGDTGAIYTWGLESGSGGPYVQNTWNQLTIDGIHADSSMTDAAPNGFFMDDQTYGQIFTDVKITDTQGPARRNNNSGDHFYTNVTGVGTFDESRMDYANIGVKATWPYVGGSFENGLNGWTTGKGTATTSSAQAHGGAKSYIQDQDTDVIHREFGTLQNKLVTLWLYDPDTTGVALRAMARVDDEAWDGGTRWRGMGVDTLKSSSNYTYRVGGTEYTSSVARAPGWHRLTWDYTSGTDVKMSIDEHPLVTQTGVTGFNQVSMGDWWTGGGAGPAYWDDFETS
jgi:hypothetical protein